MYEMSRERSGRFSRNQCSRFLKPPKKKHGAIYMAFERFFDGMTNLYDRTLKVVLRHRLATVTLSFVLLLAIGVPHLPRRTDRRRHRRVDDHVAGDVQAGDPVVRIDHRQLRSAGQTLADRRLDRAALVRWELLRR